MKSKLLYYYKIILKLNNIFTDRLIWKEIWEDIKLNKSRFLNNN